jgi:hypothetical protein
MNNVRRWNLMQVQIEQMDLRKMRVERTCGKRIHVDRWGPGGVTGGDREADIRDVAQIATE